MRPLELFRHPTQVEFGQPERKIENLFVVIQRKIFYFSRKSAQLGSPGWVLSYCAHPFAWSAINFATDSAYVSWS